MYNFFMVNILKIKKKLTKTKFGLKKVMWSSRFEPLTRHRETRSRTLFYFGGKIGKNYKL